MAILGFFSDKPNAMGKIKRLIQLVSIGFLLMLSCVPAWSQTFTKADSLLGSLNPLRSCYEVKHYVLDLMVHVDNQFLEGEVEIGFEAVSKTDRLQIDLAENMEITGMLWYDKMLEYKRVEGTRAIIVYLDQMLDPGEHYVLTVRYSGHPQAAKHAPWDGGFVWSADTNNNHWVGVACEGEGASIWWPCKDHLSDEPDSVRMIYTVPKGLTAVGNGKLISKEEENKWERFTWEVANPINNYNVTLNIAKYAHIQDHYVSAIDGDTLNLDYYVLDYNREVATRQFQQVKPMLDCFEAKLGKYPFYEDGYKLVETPYLGMEHQSAIAYGNHYLKGYLGRDDSKIGFDYIVIHESGHEWFGNSISTDDIAALWIHESFTTYTEALYVECQSSYEEAIDYLHVQRGYVVNRNPILGPTGVHFDGWNHDSDQYYKGSWMLQTLRAALNDDEAWFDLLREFVETFHHRITNTEEVIAFFDKRLPFDAEPVMYEYLRHAKIPTLEYQIVPQRKKQYKVRFRWKAEEEGFNLPVDIMMDDGQTIRIHPTTEWDELNVVGFKPGNLTVDARHFFINAKNLDTP